MNIDIKAENIQPRRQTFANIARRFGSDRPATRYEEATFDVQATANFHYRPLYQPEFEIFDPRRTAIVMSDWYKFKDPRQLYYATYNMSRAAMNQTVDQNFAFVEGRGMLDRVAAPWLQKVKEYLIPLRHYEWGANMNNQLIADWGYGTQLTSAAAFCGGDRLGMAQIISRIGLALDGNTGTALQAGREVWLSAPYWQGVRRNIEDSFVEPDWFQTLVAQDLAMDGILHPLVFGRFDAEGQQHNAAPLAMLSTFMTDWYPDNARWVDMAVRTAAAKSPANAALLADWYGDWSKRAVAAAQPLAEHVLGAGGKDAVAAVATALDGRVAKLGLAF